MPRACPVSNAGAQSHFDIVVMGVSGSGKSLVGEALAKALGAAFIEGDRLHPAGNVARMASGLPLNDTLREAWLDRIGAELVEAKARGERAVVACSALKRIYRDRLRGCVPTLVFVYLEIDVNTAALRVASREGHFMPVSLVASQFEDLEPPIDEPNVIIVNGTWDVETIVERVVQDGHDTLQPPG